MPLAIDLDLQNLLKDRYDPMELLELLGLSMDDVIEAFDEKIKELLDEGELL